MKAALCALGRQRGDFLAHERVIEGLVPMRFLPLFEELPLVVAHYTAKCLRTRCILLYSSL